MYKSEQTVIGDIGIDDNELHLENLIDCWSELDYQNPILMSCENQVILENQEDTMDASSKFCLMPMEFKPISPIGPPKRENFSGNLKFQIEISGADTNKSKFMYSHRLNRIYVSMGHGFSVQLKWDAATQPYPAMFVRATPVFSDKAQTEKRVTRCIQHYHETKNGASMSESMRCSVLHSTRDVGTQDVFYCGGESPDVWYSVVVRFAAPSAHVYQFVCKNSCSSGINRRTIAIIFTLEDHTGHVYGRQSVGARACSCPKRDVKREEAEEAPRGKRPLPTAAEPAPAGGVAPAPRTKKIKLEVRPEEPDVFLIQAFGEQIPVQNKEALLLALQVLLTTSKREREWISDSHPLAEKYDTSIAALSRVLDKHREQPK